MRGVFLGRLLVASGISPICLGFNFEAKIPCVQLERRRDCQFPDRGHKHAQFSFVIILFFWRKNNEQRLAVQLARSGRCRGHDRPASHLLPTNFSCCYRN